MDLRVDDEGMRALVAKSIMDAITPESRERMIGDAIKAMLFEPRSQYDKKTPLQRAFADAVEQHARKFSMEALENNTEFKEKIEALFADVANKLFGEKRDELVDSIASKMRSALDR